MTKKASQTIWLQRRIRQLGIDKQTITNYWKSEGHCHLELCAPVWSGAITVAQARDLARVQKRAVAAITGSWREEYGAACSCLGLEEDLGAKRLRLCHSFAKKKQLLIHATRTCLGGFIIHTTPGVEGRSGGSRPARPGVTSSLPGLS